MKVKHIFKDNFINSGKVNMELDLRMLNKAIESKQDFLTLRFYNWEPRCISLGRNQKNDSVCDDFGIDVVKRPTGGRALLHDNELTYCCVYPILKGQSVSESYKEISDAIILGFKKVGIELDYSSSRGENVRYCMNISSGADISYHGKKIIGSAQFRSCGYVLQHGSILYDADFDLIEKIFNQKVEKKSLTTLKEIDPKITQEQLIEALLLGFKEKFTAY